MLRYQDSPSPKGSETSETLSASELLASIFHKVISFLVLKAPISIYYFKLLKESFCHFQFGDFILNLAITLEVDELSLGLGAFKRTYILVTEAKHCRTVERNNKVSERLHMKQVIRCAIFQLFCPLQCSGLIIALFCYILNSMVIGHRSKTL